MCGTSADAKYNMLNRLQPASRLLIRASLGVFTAIVLLLIQSAFWSTRVSAWMQAIIFAIALLSYFRPQYGLLAIALLAPLGQVGSRTLDSQMRGAEAKGAVREPVALKIANWRGSCCVLQLVHDVPLTYPPAQKV